MPEHTSPSLAEAICTGSGPKKGDPTSFLKKKGCNANEPQSCSCLSLIFQDPTFVIWTGFRLKCHMWGGVQCTARCRNFAASQAKRQAGVHLLRVWNWEGAVNQDFSDRLKCSNYTLFCWVWIQTERQIFLIERSHQETWYLEIKVKTMGQNL